MGGELGIYFLNFWDLPKLEVHKPTATNAGYS